MRSDADTHVQNLSQHVLLGERSKFNCFQVVCSPKFVCESCSRSVNNFLSYFANTHNPTATIAYSNDIDGSLTQCSRSRHFWSRISHI